LDIKDQATAEVRGFHRPGRPRHGHWPDSDKAYRLQGTQATINLPIRALCTSWSGPSPHTIELCSHPPLKMATCRYSGAVWRIWATRSRSWSHCENAVGSENIFERSDRIGCICRKCRSDGACGEGRRGMGNVGEEICRSAGEPLLHGRLAVNCKWVLPQCDIHS